ncbi:MAG: hypothetical protein IBX41_04055 [Methanophagales archaeon]|nr:hypothetical protein [Methanophagales archaeon]
MEDKKYELRIPRGITTGIVFEAAGIFELEVDQEEASVDDAFDMTTGLPIKDYVPQIVLRGDSQEKLLAAREFIYKKHEEWIENLEKWREMRREQIRRKIRPR